MSENMLTEINVFTGTFIHKHMIKLAAVYSGLKVSLTPTGWQGHKTENQYIRPVESFKTSITSKLALWLSNALLNSETTQILYCYL